MLLRKVRNRNQNSYFLIVHKNNQNLGFHGICLKVLKIHFFEIYEKGVEIHIFHKCL